MLRKTLLTLLMLLLPIVANSKDIWEEYSTHLTYNYLIKTNFNTSNNLSNQETFDIMTKSFSQSFGLRFSSVAHQKTFMALVCAFSNQPEKCLFDSISNDVFNEIHFINAPEISQKNLKRLNKFLSSQIFSNETKFKLKESKSTSHTKLNFKYGIDSDTFMPIVKFPFYTYKNIYIEPKIDLKKNITLTFIKDRWVLEIENNQTTLKYYIPHKLFLRDNIVISYRSGIVGIENSLIVW